MTQTLTKSKINSLKHLFDDDMQKWIHENKLTASQADKLFSVILKQPMCRPYLCWIDSTHSQEDRFDGFYWVDKPIKEAVHDYIDYQSDCGQGELFWTGTSPQLNLYIVGAYQDTCYAMDGQDYEDTWDYAILIERKN